MILYYNDNDRFNNPSGTYRESEGIIDASDEHVREVGFVLQVMH